MAKNVILLEYLFFYFHICIGGTEKLTDQEALEEIKSLQNQLQVLLQRTPHNGAAISTISLLLEAFKQPRSNQLTIATAMQSSARKTSNESLIAIKNKAIASSTATTTVDKCVSTESIDSFHKDEKHHATTNDAYAGGSNCSSISFEKHEKHNGSKDNVTPANNDNGNNLSVEDEINRSNVSFDDLDLRCMCSDDEEDCQHYTESGFEPILVKQCSDLHLDNKLKNNNSNKKKSYDSCDNLYGSKKSCIHGYYCQHQQNEPTVKMADSTTKRESKKFYHSGYNPHHKHYRKQHQPRYECKLDSEIVAKKLLNTIKCEAGPIKLDAPPPVPPRKSLPLNNNTNSASITCKNVNILSVSNLTVKTLKTIPSHLDDQNLNNESNIKEDSGNDSTTSTDNTAQVESKESLNRCSSVKSQKRKKSPEKRLVLDLNDRSKYTEEVSV